MHEMSLAGAVVQTVERHAAGRPVTLVSLRAGRLRQVMEDSLRFYFDIVARGTVCAGARLEIEDVPARLRCVPCAREWEIDLPLFRCTGCGGADVVVVSGEEFEVESIDVETGESADDRGGTCTAPR